MRKLFAILLLLAVAASLFFHAHKSFASSDAALTEKDFTLKGFGLLHLAFPAAWTDSIQWKTELGAPVDELRFLSKSGESFAVVVEIIHLDEKAVRNLNTRSNLVDIAKREMPAAVESSLEIHDFKGPHVSGSYFSLTDKTVSATDPKPGEYKYLTQGYATLDSMVLALRVVSNKANGNESALALDMLKSARYAPIK